MHQVSGFSTAGVCAQGTCRILLYFYFRTVSSMVYYAIAIYSNDFSNDRFMNFFLSGVSELLALLMTFLLVKYIGRPRTAFALMFTCGISSLALPFIPIGNFVYDVYVYKFYGAHDCYGLVRQVSRFIKASATA